MAGTAKHFRKRAAILDCIRQTTVHPSAEWIYAQLKPDFPDLSLGTVYRNLTLFREQGLIMSIGTVNGVERFDGFTQPHVHFICTQCGQVMDLKEVQIPQEVSDEVMSSTGGSVGGVQLTFTGICRECMEENQQNEQEEVS